MNNQIPKNLKRYLQVSDRIDIIFTAFCVVNGVKEQVILRVIKNEETSHGERIFLSFRGQVHSHWIGIWYGKQKHGSAKRVSSYNLGLGISIYQLQ